MVKNYVEFLGRVLLTVILLATACTNLHQETIEPVAPTPEPVREIYSTYYSRGIEMYLGSTDNFTIRNQNIAIAYNSRDGENHVLTLTVNGETETILVSPDNKVLGSYYCKYKLGNVSFEIYPITREKVIDKDKDGRIGEDPQNEKDDDNDGLIDEDPQPYYNYTYHSDWNTDLLGVACFVPPEKPLKQGQVAPAN
jgi:hypothetical protein